MPELSIIQQIAVWVIPVLLAITLHEAAHAWAANHLGDTTAKFLGRLSFNPLKHIDLFGTVIVPIVILVLSNFNFVFGWAKPVPISAAQFRSPRLDTALVTMAGPGANILMAIAWVSLLKIILIFASATSMVTLFMVLVARAGLIINILLACVNLIPIPPLDGGRIVASVLSPKHAVQYNKIEPYGFFILLALMFAGILNAVITPLINYFITALTTLFNL